MGLRAQFELLANLKKRFADEADFYFVYGREAFPAQSQWPAPVPDDQPVRNPDTLQERAALAQRFAASISSEIPILLDDLDDHAMQRYDAYPFRVYGISADNVIAVPSTKGAAGFGTTIRRITDWLDKSKK